MGMVGWDIFKEVRVRTLIAVVVLAMASCGPIEDRTNVPEALAVASCGSWEDYRAERDRVLAEGKEMARPDVGATACRVLAMLGRPHDHTMVAVGNTQRAHWTYWIPPGTAPKARLIVMAPGPRGVGVVESVVW